MGEAASASNVVAWLDTADEDRVFISVSTLAELSRGVELLPAGLRRARLTDWLTDDLPARFEDRILDIDRRVAMQWGVVTVRCQAAGGVMTTMDAFFAATAEVHAMTLVTRNVSDFRRAGIALLDPWTAA